MDCCVPERQGSFSKKVTGRQKEEWKKNKEADNEKQKHRLKKITHNNVKTWLERYWRKKKQMNGRALLMGFGVSSTRKGEGCSCVF